MNSLDTITEETLAAVKKAQTNGITAGTNITGVDLAGLVSLVPVETPWRNQLSRVGSTEGAKFAQWRALLDVNNQQPNPFVGFDYAGNLAVLDEIDVFSPYQPLAMAGLVTQDAVDLAKGYADARAIAAMNSLNQLMIAEDKALIGAQAFALPTPAAPTVTASTTGGSIAASTAVAVSVAARTGMNYCYGGSTIASAQTSVTTSSTGATNSVSASVQYVKGAVAYDWWVGNYYYTTTTVNAVTITSVPAANNAAPSLPDLSTTVPATRPTVDSSANANAINGLLASLAGDYAANGLVTPGTGTPSGAVFQSLDGGTLTLNGSSITQIDNLLLSIYNNVRLSPTALMMSSQEASNLTHKILGTNAAVTYLQPNDETGRAEAVASGYVGTYINAAAAGARVKLEVHPHVPPGTMIARTDRVPFPGSNIGNVFEVRTLRDYADFTYGTARNPGVAGGGPREEFEIRCVEAFVNRAPVACGVLSNIANG